MRAPASLVASVVPFALLLAACGDGAIAFPDGGVAWPGVPVPPYANQPRLAVTNNAADSIGLVSMDLPQPVLLGVRPVGDSPVELEGPHHLVTSPDGRFIYTALSNYVPGSGSGPHGAIGLGTVPGSVVKLRADTLAKIAEVAVDRNPGDIIRSRDGARLYVSHFDALRFLDQQQKGLPPEAGFSAVAIVDADRMTAPEMLPVCPTAHGMALSADERTLYVTCGYTDELAIVDLKTRAVRRLFVGPAPGKNGDYNYFPYAAAASLRDGSVWLSCNRSGDLRVYDPKKDAIDPARTLSVGGVPLFGAFLSDGRTLLLPHQGDDALSLVDTATSQELFRVALPPAACRNAHAAIVLPDDDTSYVVCEGDHVAQPGTLVAFSVKARIPLGSVGVGLYSDGVAPLPAYPR